MKSRNVLLGVGAAAVLLGVGGAAPAVASSALDAVPAANAQTATNLYDRTELYFGSSKPNGGSVTPAQFDGFVDKDITPAFPDGLTLLTGRGQWKDDSGKIEKETSYVIIILYPVTDRAANGKIEHIRTDYKKAFQQESVLRTDSLQRVSF
ncbi:DUF3574 domain-containing protein [Fodinicola feengrottensis]|uniref:DUF3574 domain-containing protein n=1 Tax=Fodinicola feengrottensis TaxID=435914 RepID=A0ABP4SRL6_9ACTN|nr:DUF3574 domain-containing protein [Fodinicola feengrottensis]